MVEIKASRDLNPGEQNLAILGAGALCEVFPRLRTFRRVVSGWDDIQVQMGRSYLAILHGVGVVLCDVRHPTGHVKTGALVAAAVMGETQFALPAVLGLVDQAAVLKLGVDLADLPEVSGFRPNGVWRIFFLADIVRISSGASNVHV